jgi:hypothetical protein
MKTIAGSFAVALLLAVSSAGQTRDNYFDCYIVKVKPEKRADFDAAAKKIVDANRRGHGDNWLAYETLYGEANTVYFVSSRKDMAAIDTATESFMKAMKETLGPNYVSVFRDMDNATLSSRGELRRRRWDMSLNMPQDQDEVLKYTGQARFLRTTIIRVRAGHSVQFEELAKMLNAATAKADPSRRMGVSQVVAGQNGSVYYATELQPTMGALEMTASARQAMGEENWMKFQQGVAEHVISTETMIAKFVPELSNPTEAVVNVSHDFWMPQTSVGSADRMAKSGKAKK